MPNSTTFVSTSSYATCTMNDSSTLTCGMLLTSLALIACRRWIYPNNPSSTDKGKVIPIPKPQTCSRLTSILQRTKSFPFRKNCRHARRCQSAYGSMTSLIWDIGFLPRFFVWHGRKVISPEGQGWLRMILEDLTYNLEISYAEFQKEHLLNALTTDSWKSICSLNSSSLEPYWRHVLVAASYVGPIIFRRDFEQWRIYSHLKSSGEEARCFACSWILLIGCQSPISKSTSPKE